MAESPRILVAIPTLGLSPRIEVMLRSLARQTVRPVEIVVALQGPQEPLRRLIAQHLANHPHVSVVTCEKGISHARNVAVAAARQPWDVVIFVDDDLVLADDFVAETARCFSRGGVDFVSAVILPEGGRGGRTAVPTQDVPLTRATVWRHALEPGSAFSRQALEAVGGFDEELGIGCPTPWQSGEGTDLMLRLMDRGFHGIQSPARVCWEEAPSEAIRSVRDRALRARRYARGTGRVYRLRLPMWRSVQLVVKSVGKVVLSMARSRRGGHPREAVSVLVGRLEGLTGRTSPSRRIIP